MTTGQASAIRPAIRPARRSDAPMLTALARASKAHWGYPPEWLERWRPGLTLTAADIDRWIVRVVTDAADEPLGFSAIVPAEPRWVLEHLWVHPPAMGEGIGRLLLRDALAIAAAAGASGLEVESDPHAAGFYLHCGARAAGAVAAPMPGAPDRTLPRFVLDAAPA